MLAKRIIPCLDMTQGRVVKGIQFVNFRDAGDPVKLAKEYDKQGADELVFLDITATVENRDILLDVVRKTAKEVVIPFSVGGGVRTVSDMRTILRAGADKVSVNTGAFKNPKLISDCAKEFGSQCVILLTSIDTDGTKKGFNVALTRQVSQAVSVPVIASGGAGKLKDFVEIFNKGFADAALAASLFHFGELTIQEVKDYLNERDIPVRSLL